MRCLSLVSWLFTTPTIKFSDYFDFLRKHQVYLVDLAEQVQPLSSKKGKYYARF